MENEEIKALDLLTVIIDLSINGKNLIVSNKLNFDEETLLSLGADIEELKSMKKRIDETACMFRDWVGGLIVKKYQGEILSKEEK